MRARKQKTDVRREQLTTAAMDSIGREGVQALSIAGVSGQAGLGASSVYRHFESKDALLDAVLEKLHRRLLGNVAEVREATPRALDRLQALMERHARLLAGDQAVPAIVFADGLTAGNPARRDKLRQIIGDYLGEIRHIVQEGQADGTLQVDPEPQTVAVLFLGVLLPAALLGQLTGGEFQILDHYRNAWPLFRKAIAAGQDIDS